MQKLGASRRFLQTVTILLSLLFLGFPAQAKDIAFSTSMIEIGKHHFTIELATSNVQLEHGLMFRNYLAPDHGMLFVYHQPTLARMWMKNTLIPLDMIFIDAKGRIVTIEHNTTPESPAIISSPEPVKAVLELAAGTAEKKHIKVGDKVKHAVFVSHPVR
ncbi:MAG: DUF192 domain-containing protein [Alphaproteobacteria bacterium]|nr:DUF192 domain-containing protein [Alphaproteobacteria bacterium]